MKIILTSACALSRRSRPVKCFETSLNIRLANETVNTSGVSRRLRQILLLIHE